MDELIIDLFAPGMGPLHRAGLGGLAATIQWLDDDRGGGRVAPERRPSGTLTFDDHSVRLAWGDFANAAPFFQKLYELAFDLRDGLIHLPGCYDPENPPENPVKAALQNGIRRTILQHNKSYQSSGSSGQLQDVTDDGGKSVKFSYQRLAWYRHQSAWEDLFKGKRGEPKKAFVEAVPIKGTLAPGAVVRHQGHENQTIIKQPLGHTIALHFALVGTLSLAFDVKVKGENKKKGEKGVLLVPHVENLKTFAERRPFLTPDSQQACHIRSPADAALQAMVRLRKRREQEFLGIRRCTAVLFSIQDWYDQQKTRAAVLDVEPDSAALDRFHVAMQVFEPRRSRRQAEQAKGGEEPRWFWADSLVRPLIADNLARGRPWFENFRSLMLGPQSEIKAFLKNEGKGLQDMIDKSGEYEAEMKLVEAIHVAMRARFGVIWRDPDIGDKTKADRTENQKQKWRLGFAQAKTPDDVRNALANMWSRSVMEAPSNKVLKASWADILPLFRDDDRWKLNRDLALLALASYGGKGKDEADDGDDK